MLAASCRSRTHPLPPIAGNAFAALLTTIGMKERTKLFCANTKLPATPLLPSKRVKVALWLSKASLKLLLLGSVLLS